MTTNTGPSGPNSTPVPFQQMQFNGDMLNILEDEGNFYVVMKPMCEVLGLNWSRQLQIMQKDEVLKSVMCNLHTTGFDGKSYKMVCLPLDYISGWLFRLDASRYEGDRKEKIVRYQRECYRVLRDHFLGNPGRVYLTMQHLEAEIARIKLMISSEIPVEIFHFNDISIRLFIIFEQPGLLAQDVIHAIQGNWDAGSSQAPSILERHGLQRDEHFIVTSIGKVAAHLGLTPDYLLSRAKLAHSIRGMTFILPQGMGLLRRLNEPLYDWYCHTVYPAVPEAYRIYEDRDNALALTEEGGAV